MSVENVQKFFELVKSNEELAQEIEKIKNKTQNKAGTVDYEQIISENVIPMAKERGLEFTLEDFLTYSSSIAPQGELSDDDLLNVSGGWSGNQMLATGLMLLTLGSSGLSMMGNIQSPGGGDGSSAGSAPTSSYSMSINNADEAAEETAEDTILQKVENSNIEKSSEDVSNEADEVIENNSEESDVADEDTGSTEDVSFNEEDAATTAQEDATEATEEETETEIETNDEAIDFSSRLGYEDLDADNKELKDVSIDWTKEDNAALEDFFAEDDEENDGIEMTEEEINIDLNEGEDVYNYEAFDVENNEETTNEGEKNDDIKEFDNFNSETQILNFNDVDEDEQLNDDEVFDLFNDAENDEDENTENTDEATNEADAEKEEVNNYGDEVKDVEGYDDEIDEKTWQSVESLRNSTVYNDEDFDVENNEEATNEVDLDVENDEKKEAQEEVNNEKTTNEEEENDDIKEFDNFNNEAQILNFDAVDEDDNDDFNEDKEDINDEGDFAGTFISDLFDENEEANELENKEENENKDNENDELDADSQTEENTEVATNEATDEVDLDVENDEKNEAQEEVSKEKSENEDNDNDEENENLNDDEADELENKDENLNVDAVLQTEENKEEATNNDKITNINSTTLKENPDIVKNHKIDKGAEWPNRVKKVYKVLKKCEDDGVTITPGEEDFWKDLKEVGERIGQSKTKGDSKNSYYFNTTVKGLGWLKTTENRNDFEQNKLKKVKQAYDKYIVANNT